MIPYRDNNEPKKFQGEGWGAWNFFWCRCWARIHCLSRSFHDFSRLVSKENIPIPETSQNEPIENPRRGRHEMGPLLSPAGFL